MIKLDEIDKKILAYIYHHYRDSITDIAKACKVSKEQVAYRMKKYEDEKLILKYATLYNYPLLGYNELFIVWLNCKDKSQVRKYLEKMHNVLTYGDMLSKYDLFINFIYRSKEEFESNFNQFLKENSENILNYNTFTTTHFELFDLKAFDIKKDREAFKIVEYKKSIKLDATDKKIMKLLEHDGRMKIVDIAKRTKLSSPAILKKLHSLKEEGIIQGVRALINEVVLGYSWSEIHLKLKEVSDENRKKIISYSRAHPHINLINFGISEYNCIIQVLYKEEEEFKQTIRDVREKFKDNILEYLTIITENEGIVKTLPFEEFGI